MDIFQYTLSFSHFFCIKLILLHFDAQLLVAHWDLNLEFQKLVALRVRTTSE